MPRPAASPEQRREQRERIRRAAAAVYADAGPQGVSARAIAVRAGVSTGTLYSYFTNLHELLRSLWLEPVARANAELEEVARAHADPVERIHALLDGYARFAFTNPDVYRGALLFVRPDAHPKPERQPLHTLPFPRLLCEAIREGQLQGRIRRGDVEELAQLLWAGVHGAIGLSTNVDIYAIARSEELAPPMIELLVESIRAPLQR